MLGRDAILAAMKRADDRLVITPLLESRQIGAASVDVRLGHQFIVLRKSPLSHLDPGDTSIWASALRRSQEKHRISLGNRFVLHPNQFVLAATLEYVSLPTNLAASVEGRSSWGRLGLIIATACSIAPGFKGCVTLEIVNSGDVPLVVYPGLKIAQIVFYHTEGKGDYRRPELGSVAAKYDCPVGPQFSRINTEQDVQIWSHQLKQTSN